jgi:4-alpha-glucanotransferase
MYPRANWHRCGIHMLWIQITHTCTIMYKCTHACRTYTSTYISLRSWIACVCIYIYTVYVCYIMPHANPYLLNMATYRERERVDLLFISILDYLSVPAVLLTFWCGIGRTEQTNQMNIPTETNLLVNWCLDLLRMVLKNPESNAWNLGRTSI